MYKSKLISVLAVAILAVFMAGCVKNYSIIQDLEAPLPDTAICTIGPITDLLRVDFAEEKKPSLEDIEKFKRFLYEEIEKREIFSMSEVADSAAQYEIRGGIMEYERGSGVTRALFGVFGGNAYVSVKLQLVDRTASLILFSGHFKAAVTHYAESGDAMFKRVAKDFAKALSKRLKKLRKQ